MFDHIGIRTRHSASMSAFYESVLAPLGYTRLVSYEGGAGFGRNGVPELWIGEGDAASSIHLALASQSRAAVDAFHTAALAAGAKDNGAPGIRADYAPSYYAAYVIDPDGNNLEAVCHSG
jgi:catechol 2,3-dioxygenase-like lactoylglutathione lyase family enzyme